jgi:hypothetical protein
MKDLSWRTVGSPGSRWNGRGCRREQDGAETSMEVAAGVGDENGRWRLNSSRRKSEEKQAVLQRTLGSAACGDGQNDGGTEVSGGGG